MTKVKSKLLIVCVAVSLLGGLAVSPASAVTVLYQAPGVDIFLGKPFNSLEFQDPFALGKWVQGYNIQDWRDADYLAPASYDEWTVSHPGAIHGNANEIWMRNAGQSINTSTQVPSTVVSIHLIGDNNDGKAEVLVDGVTRAILDMGTRNGSQTVLVIVKYLPFMNHNIDVLDQGWAPSGMGDDVAVLGACALGWRKWFPNYWFLDCRIRLLPTPMDTDLAIDPTGGLVPIPVTIPNGWWNGWYWWHHQCCWLRPWLGPIWRYRPWYPWPYWRYRIDWPYWPYYRFYQPWWNNWRWWGGPWFWGFKKCLHYTWKPWWHDWPAPWPYKPPIIYWWSYYWDPEGEGHCVEMVTQSDEENPAGGRIRPVSQDVAQNLVVESHQFAVNGGYDADSVEGEFTALEWVNVGPGGSGLRDWLENNALFPPPEPNDVNDFMESDIVQQLVQNCQDNPEAQVGLQYAQWQHPEPDLEITVESAVLIEGGAPYEYEVKLIEPTMMDQKVVVIPSSGRLDLGMGPGEPMELMFPPGVMSHDVMVHVADDGESQGTETASIAHFIAKSETTTVGGSGVVAQVTIQDNDCGGLGMAESDLNGDCKVNAFDFAVFANDWLDCTHPEQP